MDRNRDRGRIKWTSLMLPEHVERLRDWKAEDLYEERPETTEWQLQAMQETIDAAWRRKCETIIKTWKDGSFYFYQGVIVQIEPERAVLTLRDPFGIERIRVHDIVDVRFGEGVSGV